MTSKVRWQYYLDQPRPRKTLLTSIDRPKSNMLGATLHCKTYTLRLAAHCSLAGRQASTEEKVSIWRSIIGRTMMLDLSLIGLLGTWGFWGLRQPWNLSCCFQRTHFDLFPCLSVHPCTILTNLKSTPSAFLSPRQTSPPNLSQRPDTCLT
ncbi:hypothetical protein BJ166DRAFT_503070 [Pestalotiopsis sp. NC0098]|nr:hypothetical protein BJ166DRAFT_503070 [Pestalotiopsis sp. NC0098]